MAPIFLPKQFDRFFAWAKTNVPAGTNLVVANGCFDLLHPGHLALLAAAKNFRIRMVGKIADDTRVLVLLNSDASVRRLKGADRPILSFDHRASLLASLRTVDAVFGFSENSPLNTMNRIHKRYTIDAVYKGTDTEGKIVRPRGVDANRVTTRRGYSTTTLVDRLVNRLAARSD